MIYNFKSDYLEGAHPSILQLLEATNLTQQEGYGYDEYSKKAKDLIKRLCNAEGEVFFVCGGTFANLVSIAHFLRPYEAVVCADTAHIATHEAGAIEASGHKLITVKNREGKIFPDDIKRVLKYFKDEHRVKPAMVYVSNATEFGTVYSEDEMMQLGEFCKENNLLFYVDGARIGNAAAYLGYRDFGFVSKYCDAFYIGATKNGGLIGEAIVINNDKLAVDFRYSIKQRGGLLAKGRLLAVQFLGLFEDNLYFKLAERANKMAKKMADAISNLGFEFYIQPQTNLLFPIFPLKFAKKLNEYYGFYIIDEFDDKCVVRLVTSWASKEEYVDKFTEDLKSLLEVCD
ncbi:threonine aldolase family protein [Hippea jasoniae]|uniref:threonine aldolase family protein n=1 Tax=Hippea jasoniae TaxID=944479 RepID=UPI000AE134BC|nr:aminotransferase class I/II-fold pyridoxal phosphate-dependent enzyme [Hippea jasoniae]